MGTLLGIPFGLLFGASVVRAVIGKSYFGDAGGVIGAELGGSGATGLLLAALAVLAGRAADRRFSLREPALVAGQRRPGPWARAWRGGLAGACFGPLVGSVIVLPALACEPRALLDTGLHVAVGMALGIGLIGIVLGVSADVIRAIDWLSKERRTVPPPPAWDDAE